MILAFKKQRRPLRVLQGYTVSCRGGYHPPTEYVRFLREGEPIPYYPSVTFGDSFSLRLGHATALTVHRTVIHYRVALRFLTRGALE